MCKFERERVRQRVELNACQFWVTISIRIEAIVAFSADVCRIKLKLIKFLFSALLLCFFSSSPTVDAAIVLLPYSDSRKDTSGIWCSEIKLEYRTQKGRLDFDNNLHGFTRSDSILWGLRVCPFVCISNLYHRCTL